MTDLLSGHEPPVTLAEMIAEVERELKMRARVFPRQVANGRLPQVRADTYMRRMTAVRDVLVLVQQGSNEPR